MDRKPQAAKRTIALLSLRVQARERGLPYLAAAFLSWDVLNEAGLLSTHCVYVPPGLFGDERAGRQL